MAGGIYSTGRLRHRKRGVQRTKSAGGTIASPLLCIAASLHSQSGHSLYNLYLPFDACDIGDLSRLITCLGKACPVNSSYRHPHVSHHTVSVEKAG